MARGAQLQDGLGARSTRGRPGPQEGQAAGGGGGWGGKGTTWMLRPGRPGPWRVSGRHVTCSDFPFRDSPAACGEQRAGGREGGGPGGDPQMRLSRWPRGQGQPSQLSTRRHREVTPVSVTLGFSTVLTRQGGPRCSVG